MATRLERRIAVYGAAGHTGRFVVSELRKRGFAVILCGRGEAGLRRLGEVQPGSEIRVASVEDPVSLDRAFAGAAAVLNCAGPFLDTAVAIMEAALRAGMHYLDVTAEQPVALAAFERFAAAARDAGVVIAPAMAFYGALGDLLATAAMAGWAAADEIRIAVALDGWKPTPGTRLTGERNTSRRRVVSKGKLEFLADPPPRRVWEFPAPFGTQPVVGLPLSETIMIARHLRVPEVHAYMNLAPLTDLHDPATPAPTAADPSGRSAQTFLVDVIARSGNQERRATARGRDIYAITAPILVEALERILDGRANAVGTLAAGELFDARDFLEALSPAHLSLEFLE